jgi:DNA-binding GntR family transcriptional regulator
MESAAQAAPLMNQDHADRLSDILLQHARAIEHQRYAEAIEIDDRFHRAITEISELPRLWRTIDISKAQLDRCRHLMLPRAGEAETTLEHHREIIRALNSRDPDRARTAMREHLDIAYRSTQAVLNGPGLG